MARNTSLSSVGRAPDCSCNKNVSADIRVSPVQVRERGPITRYQLVYMLEKVDTSGLLSKSGSGGQYHIINRLRTLLVDLSREALREMNIGRNQRAKRLLSTLSNINQCDDTLCTM